MNKKMLSFVMLIFGVLVFVGCASTAEHYIKFTEIGYIVDILNEAPTMETLETLVGVSLRNEADRINEQNRRINEIRRQAATTTTTSQTTGTIWTQYGMQRVDLTTTTTHRIPDSELNLRRMVEMTNILETISIPRGARNYFNDRGRISFYFAHVEGMDTARLLAITVTEATYFGGIDFTQFENFDHEEILQILISTYGLHAEILWSGTGAGHPSHIEFYYENIQFILRPRNGMVTVEAIFLDETPTRPANRSDMYKQFADIDFLINLIHEAPTQREVNDLGIRLVNRGERLNSDNEQIHNILETRNIPRNTRDCIESILFRFDYVEDNDDSRLYQISIQGLSYFHGINFSQFDDETDAEKIFNTLTTRYGLDAVLTGMGVAPVPVITFFHEGVEFRMFGLVGSRGGIPSMTVTVTQ